MGTGPRTVVQPQPAAAPRFGLIASIPATTDVTRWEVGITYRPEGCNPGQIFDPCDVPNDEITFNPGPSIVEWDPYVLAVSHNCSTFSGFDDNSAELRRLLAANQETLLGHELWMGTQAQASGWPNTWLADSSDPNYVELSSGSPVDYVHALACLENYLAHHNGGQQGVIHATVQTVAHWESFRLLRREGNNILTFKDTLVIPSPGYTGTSPDGDISDGNVWAYATDMPRIFLGDVQVFEVKNTIDRRQNTVQMVAQRFALAEWQRCRHAGVQIDITLCSEAY